MSTFLNGSVLVLVMISSLLWGDESDLSYTCRTISSLKIESTADFVEYTLTLSDGLVFRGGELLFNQDPAAIIASANKYLPVGLEVHFDTGVRGMLRLEEAWTSIRWIVDESSLNKLPYIESVNVAENEAGMSVGWLSCSEPKISFSLSDGTTWRREGTPDVKQWKVGDHILVEPRQGISPRLINVDCWNTMGHPTYDYNY